MVAERLYARALFEAAQEVGRVRQVGADLAALARAFEEVPALRSFMMNPEVETAAKADLLGELATGADELVENFVRLIAEKGRGAALPEMQRAFEELAARAENRLAVELQTARELSDEEAESIVAAIEAASGRTVDATRTVDASLIGGIVLQIGSFRADGSVRGRLERLRRELATTH